MDTAVDTEKLEIFGTIITEVKMEGRVPASSHLVYDCSHGEWLLAQMAYDRKIRLFSSRYGMDFERFRSCFGNDLHVIRGQLVPALCSLHVLSNYQTAVQPPCFVEATS